MAEIASPARTPRSLRRHYPHQVQGVSGKIPDSQPRGSPAFICLRIEPARRKSIARTTGTKVTKEHDVQMTSWPLMNLAC